MKTLLKLVSVLFLLVTWINAQVTIIHCGVLINGNSEELSKNISIVIKNATIIDISNGLKHPTRDDSLIDLENLPEPDVIAEEISDNLESALESVTELIENLKKPTKLDDNH